MSIERACQLSDAALEAEVRRLVACERQVTVRLIVHLAELDTRRLYLGAGFSSLFTYCVGILRLSESEAYNRIEAARAVRKWPRLQALLLDGGLNLTTLRLIAPHLTEANEDEVLGSAVGKSKRQVEELVARWSPRPDVATLVRRVAGAVAQPGSRTVNGAAAMVAETPDAVGGGEAAQGAAERPVDPAPPLGPASMVRSARPDVAPLAPDRYLVRFTATAATREKLRRAQDLLRHAVPDGDVAQIIDRALTALLDDIARKQQGAARRPRARREPGAQRMRRNSRNIPAHVKRVVWARDGGRCAFRSKEGRRCAETSFLQFHHLDPYGIGGEATPGNIALRCRAHNLYEGELAFGRAATARGAGTRSGTSSGAGRLGARRPGAEAPATETAAAGP